MNMAWNMRHCTLDQFAVPQIINRNVLQALEILQSKKQRFYCTDDITIQVKKQMGEVGKASVLRNFVRESLANMTYIGLLACTGCTEYCLRHSLSRIEDI